MFGIGNNKNKALHFLEKQSKNSNLDSLINSFNEMCQINIKEEKEKQLLFETGTFDFTGKKMFYFSLSRQFPNDDEEYYQIHLDILYETDKENSLFKQATWNFDIEEDFISYIKNSKEYNYLKDKYISEVKVYIDET